MDLHRWICLLLKAGIAILLVITICDAGSKQPRRTPAHKLAQQTGAAHYEERYEKVLPSERRSNRLRKRASDEDVDYEVYQGVVGRPGIDFPILPRIPQTTFSCRTFGNGYFADLETDCQVFHICEEGRKISFLCPNGTIFQQSELTCDWWFKVNCASSPGHYAESSEMLIRAQNRNKQNKKITPQHKNEFYSSESDYSRERVNHKNSYPVKSSTKSNNGRRRNQSSNNNPKHFDSEEIPSVESVDFEDLSSNSASQETGNGGGHHYSSSAGSGSASYEHKSNSKNGRKPPERRRISDKTEKNDKIISKDDSSDEMQEPAESTFFGSGNRNNVNNNNHNNNDVKDNGYIYGKPKDNGYIYENLNKSRKNGDRDRESKQRNNNRNQNKYENENRRISKDRSTTVIPLETSRFSESGNRPLSQQNRKDNKNLVSSNLIPDNTIKRTTTPAPHNLVNNFKLNRNSETGKIETTKQTPFYTPTIPTIINKLTTKTIQNLKQPKVTTEKYGFTATTTKKPAVSYNVFNLQTKTTTDTATSTESTTEFTTTTTRNNYIIGLRNTHKDDPSSVNQVLPTKSGNSEKSSPRNSKGRTFTTTEYPETTTFSGGRTNARKFTTTTENSSSELSTSAPTYLPQETTTFRSTSISPTYLPTTTKIFRSTSSGPTFVPKETTTFRGSTNGATYLPTTSIPTSTNGPTYLPKETTTFRTSSAGPTYLPKEEITTYRPTTSTSGPTYLPTSTFRPSTNGATYLPTAPTPPSKVESSVSDHVIDMIRTLNDLKNDLNVDTKTLNEEANKYLDKPPRPGLEIPPSSGPETLVSLASYFAGEELANVSLASRSTSTEPVNVKENVKIDSGLLSNRTVLNYESLFGLSNSKPTEPTYLPDILSPEFKGRDNNDLETQHSSGLLGNAIGKPETRKIAQVFTNALSAYLEDPDSFRQVLSEVRPTEPPIELEAGGAPPNYRKPVTTVKPEFDRGTGATYLPKPTTTTMGPPTATTTNDELEVLDFSDVTLKSKNRVKLRPTTEYNLGRVTSNAVKNKPVSRIRFGISSAEESKKLQTTTIQPNDIAVEINKEFKLSTTKPIPLSFDLVAPEINTASTTNQPESSTTFSDSLLFPIGPKGRTGKPYIPALSAELLPPGISDEDEDMLQRAQSQSFLSSRNELNKNNKSDRTGKATKDPLHSEPLIQRNRSITSRSKLTTTTGQTSAERTTQSPWAKITKSVYLDPLTINDGLMEKFRTTTSSPFTYLPKSTTLSTPTTTDINPTRIELTSMFSDIKNAEPTIISRTSKTFSELSSELLPPTDGMHKIAIQMFGGLNETAAGHLMNVMKKAETNSMARRLILLLIQTCDEDYSKTVEQSRKALLNALIGMDSEYSFDDEIEVIKLKPRRQKSINSVNRSANLIRTTTDRIPVTTYRRSVQSSASSNKITTTTTTVRPSSLLASTTDFSQFTTTLKPLLEETTRFEIRVEDPEELTSTSTFSPLWAIKTTTNIPEISTTYRSNSRTTPTTITTTQNSYTTTDLPSTISPIKANSRRHSRTQFRIEEDNSSNSTAVVDNNNNSRQSSKRKAKDIEVSLGNSSDLSSHKNSDERALELLKSLYSLASKFGKR